MNTLSEQTAVLEPAAIGNGNSIAATPMRQRPRESVTSPGQVLAIVCVGIVLANLDLFIVNVALPSIARDFGNPKLEGLSWVLNGYAIVYAALLVFFGRMAERYHRNRSFLLGIALFTAASAACAAATGTEMLVAFRLVQAAGAALMTPTSLGLLLASFPADRRSGAVRTWTAIGGVAAAFGPLAGGLLVGASWRWIFLVNVPIGLAALIVGWRKLPDVPGHAGPRPDLFAAALVTIGIGALTFGIVKVRDWGFASIGAGLSFATAGLFLTIFVRHCLRSRNPLVDPALFHIRNFTGASLAAAPFSAAFGGFLLSSAIWQQEAWGWSALKTGATIAPGPLLVPITSLLLAGRLIARFGAATVMAAGIVCFTGGIVWWAMVPDLTPSWASVVGGMILVGTGVGLTLPTLMAAGTSSLPPSSFATGSAVINMIRQTGLAVGVAVFVAIIGSPHSAVERLGAFRQAWWILAAISILSLVPTLVFIRRSRSAKGKDTTRST